MLRGALRTYKRRAHLSWLAAIALSLVALSTANAADFETGYQAYQRGDFAIALQHWRPLAEAGNAKAQFNLGVMYDEGRGLAPDRKKAIEWWHKAAAQGDENAMHNLAMMYLFSPQSDANHTLAIELIEKAAKKGLARSQYAYGKIYLHGHGTEKDEEKARN